MKKFSKVGLVSGIGFLVMLLCCGLALYYDGYFLPYKPCRPLEFPSLKVRPFPRQLEIYEYRTNLSVDEVTALIDNKIDPIVLSEEQYLNVVASGVWKRKQQADGTQVYQCISGDINGITIEQGCMYIREASEGTLIQTDLSSFETSTFPCDTYTVAPLSTPQY